ncbi:putative quinol monooxygenase [Thermocoleostomius sinensis]|jgi:quinol monooxygenase YgiN|uniref:Quinol monooxygenase n=1 Tax=Thermocoleostomius sinensis A174 TaxID=2016057 RepID=A0A9E9C8Y9_9CYAN|nr:putative quinol monooxygenase [Thermocoleostomius sinensis]WAL58952.1 putative quinol monooxygenase [Thermocoleostomius sinensis A174]
MSLTIIAKLKAKAGAEEHLYQELRRVIPLTIAEAGCITFDLHRSLDDPSLFMIYENWTDRAVWEDHMQTEYIQAFQTNTKEAIDDWDIFLLKRDEE